MHGNMNVKFGEGNF